jgi:hypothetical protein
MKVKKPKKPTVKKKKPTVKKKPVVKKPEIGDGKLPDWL